jgi:7,8-dihydropterin-6-yl-methyl-4-(beta-D-ribofuranosyl)aminobenzene 5'-phosphate synthase
LLYLGQIERLNDYEAQQPIGTVHLNGKDIPDMILDDTALAYRADQGLVVITGCSHSGICNIVEYARKLTGVRKIVDIIGGFHLLDTPEKQMGETKAFFEALAPERVYACHCTDLKAKIELAQVVNVQEVGSGLSLEY